MKRDKNPLNPYKTLGNKIKRLRLIKKSKISELCSAIELDEPTFKKIESGHIRPDEDVLELIISYLNLQEKDADRLWELAGYDDTEEQIFTSSEDGMIQKSLVMLFSASQPDQKTLYSDALDVHYDRAGLVLSFKQIAGNNKPNELIRIGMSWDQAREVQKTLARVFLTKEINPNSSSSSDSNN